MEIGKKFVQTKGCIRRLYQGLPKKQKRVYSISAKANLESTKGSISICAISMPDLLQKVWNLQTMVEGLGQNRETTGLDGFVQTRSEALAAQTAVLQQKAINEELSRQVDHRSIFPLTRVQDPVVAE